MIWLIFGVMLLAAALCVAWPLYRRERRLSPGLLTGVGTVLVVSAVVYSMVGTPVPPAMPDVGEMMASLEARLAEHPDDLDGWKMLGRSYMQLENYPEAVRAFERAVDLEGPNNAQTLVSLGEAVLGTDRDALTGRAGQLFENAVTVGPDNPRALFYAGMAAAMRGDTPLAADRWEALLAQSPPPEIQAILRERIAVWRGEASAAPAAASAGPVIQVDVSLSDDARAAVGPDATVYIIARDPAQPSPPIAAVRRKASELPLTVALGDADSMIPGRLLSSFDQLEIVARASLSGQPLAQAGDWYGQQTIAAGDTVQIRIEQKVP
ncbi:MAG TPA: tetratricopeptide repeat protein [Woeseiaceae bacterium]|nr:tetratricopeptide repeat protein [Woeseiaceae bacterium]